MAVASDQRYVIAVHQTVRVKSPNPQPVPVTYTQTRQQQIITSPSASRDCTPGRPVTYTQPEPTRRRKKRICSSDLLPLFIFTLAIVMVYGAMMILGAIHFHDCPDTRMALYTVVQGATVMFNTALFATWLIWDCISDTFMGAFGVLAILSNLVWCIVGAVWIASSPCRDIVLFWYAIGFSVPIWLLLFVLCVNFWCCRE